jgi:hypothetical protein
MGLTDARPAHDGHNHPAVGQVVGKELPQEFVLVTHLTTARIAADKASLELHRLVNREQDGIVCGFGVSLDARGDVFLRGQ